jgi:hypothetical protein
MKTPAFFLLAAGCLLAPGASPAQQGTTPALPIYVQDLNLAPKIDTANTALTLANDYLNKLAKMAGDYGTGTGTKFADDVRTMRDALTGNGDGLAKKVQQISDVLGDPDSSDAKKNFSKLISRVNDWINDGKLPDNPKYDSGIDDPTSKDDGEKAFNTTADGLFESIGSTYKPDPNKSDTEPREKKLYVGAVNQLAAVNHYYTIREAAIDRREKLQELLKDTLDEIHDSKDFATLLKQTALVESIESQLKVCNDDINTAYNDVAVRSIQMFTMSQIKTIADNEPINKQLKDKTDSSTDLTPTKVTTGGSGTTTGGTGGTGSSTTGFFPWIKYSF